VYDGLVALRRSGDPDGFTLVPDLATRLPRPASGGTTYTFTLRRGIRYSTGTPARASDFRRGIQRQLSFGANPAFYEDILGAQACHQHPSQCHLSAGIVTNDAAGTVTFRLRQPDPDFLYRLALLLAVPAPPGAPSHPIGKAPFLPGTGPYKISQYRPGVSLTLVRNSHFRQWSYAAQPAGYPDVIRYEQLADPRKQQSAVAAGTADLVDISNGLPYRPLAIRYPTRIHSGNLIFTTFVVLNTRQPPFSNIKARQAVNYAIDRARIIRLLHFGPGEAAFTCQILPAGFPGHQNYCPYTTGPKNGLWHGPDLAKAMRLVKASGTTHEPVTVWVDNAGPGDRALGAYLGKLLTRLGYRAIVRDIPEAQYVTAIFNAYSKIQMGEAGTWAADYPTASDFFLPDLTCHSFYADPAHTLNIAGFCDPQADRLAGRAQAAEVTDPAAARRLWAQVDRIVTDQAPWVPILNASTTVFVSARVGNYQASPFYGPLLDQIWIR
jgi:ABC-type transport system substrate-binding protein